MAISSINPAKLPASVGGITSSAPAQSVNNAKANDRGQPATVVTISAQAKRLSLTESASAPSPGRINQTPLPHNVNSAAAATIAAKAPTGAESHAVQARENHGGGRINTYA